MSPKSSSSHGFHRRSLRVWGPAWGMSKGDLLANGCPKGCKRRREDFQWKHVPTKPQSRRPSTPLWVGSARDPPQLKLGFGMVHIP
ncbi:hypothetical protein JTE90_005887 [Oedothorax gibbosus]|uniref:Uncharacterized protein n=1 Tax=Oedothorax gibbosus TaxID=931172 RepID=A0AAV6TP68_9ARAC|nr:hypothetical protein JTE90_005887 [Oedothorax gibbosus]